MRGLRALAAWKIPLPNQAGTGEKNEERNADSFSLILTLAPRPSPRASSEAANQTRCQTARPWGKGKHPQKADGNREGLFVTGDLTLFFLVTCSLGCRRRNLNFVQSLRPHVCVSDSPSVPLSREYPWGRSGLPSERVALVRWG